MTVLFRHLFPRKSALRTLPSLEAYQKWARDYPPHAHNALMRAEESAVLELMPLLAGLRVLDLASGTGRYADIAQERGAASVIALDNSEPMLHGNRSQHRAVSSMDAIPLMSSSVDVVLCGLAVGHIPSLEAVVTEIGRVLVTGGTALISDVHPVLFMTGAQRTFRSQGQVYAVEHYVHWYSDMHAACHRVGLSIDAVCEPRLAETDQSASGTNLSAPVAIVYRLKKL